MTKNTNHIDQIARQKLLDAKVDAPASAWGNLVSELDQKPLKKRIFFFRRVVGAAAGIILLISLGLIFLNPSKNEIQIAKNNTAVDSTKRKTETIEKALIYSKNIIVSPATIEYKTQAETLSAIEIPYIQKAKLAYMKLVDYILPIEIKQTGLQFIADNNLSKPTQPTFDWSKYEYVNEENSIDKNNKDLKIGLGYSPSYASVDSPTNDMVYANAYPGGELVNSFGSRVNEKLIPSFTFGANLSIDLSDRWSLLSGVYYLNQKNEIQNFYVIENSAQSFSEFSTNSSMGNINISNNDIIYERAEFSSQSDINSYSNVSNYDSDLIQQFEFIEIPLLLSYKIINNNWSIALIGGLNAGFVVGNSVFMKNFESEKIGSTEDINTIIFKSVIGFSFEYPLSKRLFLTVSPSYKYQVNNLNKIKVNNYHLRFFDFKTGISYHF